MGIKESSICNLCNRAEDSNEHMLIHCQISTDLWMRVESWINEIGVTQYSLTDELKTLGELDRAYWINIIILNTKLQNSTPSLFKVKMFTRNSYNYEELKYTMQDKENVFEKRWGILSDYYENSWFFVKS